MKAELKDINPTFVSYVKKGANKKTFFFTKSDLSDENKDNFEKEIKILFKKEDPKRLVYGIVYSPNEVDSQGDYATEEEIEKAAHKFLKEARNIDKQHDFIEGAGEVVESYISPVDFVLGQQEIKKGAWVLVTKASDEIWESVVKGDITGYSMAGKAIRLAKEDNNVNDYKTNDEQVKGFFNMVKSFFTGTTQQSVDTSVIANTNQPLFNEKSDKDLFLIENKEEEVKDMTKQELETILKTALEPIENKINQMEDSNKNNNEDINKSDMEQIMKEAINPLVERIVAIEKTRNLSKQMTDEQGQQPIKKENKLFSNLGI